MGYNEDNSRLAKEFKETGVLRLKDGCKAVTLKATALPSNVNTYKAVLQATQDVFGEENMTVEVMLKAIDTGRSIALQQATITDMY